jgi:membrane protease YdiL (CAAX protease family)
MLGRSRLAGISLRTFIRLGGQPGDVPADSPPSTDSQSSTDSPPFTDSPPAGDDRSTLLVRVAALFAVGLLGVLALVATTYVQFSGRANLPFSPLVLALLSALVPTLLLAAAVVVGCLTAPRVGLRSHLTAWVTDGVPLWPALAREWRAAAAVGGGLGAVVLVLDVAFQQVVGPITSPVVVADDALLALVGSVPLRFLYGGITEELLLRWGLMSLLVWVGWRAVQSRGQGTPAPSSRVMWAGIVTAAVVFGLGHLPALAATGSVSLLVAGRTVLLNAVLGVGFGWLFWRRSLEAAMLGHVAFHVLVVTVSAVALLAGLV